MRSNILISMKKKEIVIKMNEETNFNEIVESLDKKLPELKKLYAQEKNPIRITGKLLNEEEAQEISNLIKQKLDVNIQFDNVNQLGLYGIKKVYEQDLENSETYFFKGGIRSGQKIETEGSIVVLGDINSGGEVIAGGNIVVLGVLRGLAHAGAKGNKKAIIASHKIESVQLRIANVLKEIEKEEIEEIKQFASLKEEEIILE